MKSLGRGLDILGSFAERPRQQFADLLAATRMPRSSLYRFLALLEARGFLRRDPLTGEWGAGMLLYRLGNSAVWIQELRQAARSLMPSLAATTGESVYLYARDGANRVCVEAIESTRGPIRHAVKPGSVFPLHQGASGKVILAFLSDAERDSLLPEGVARRRGLPAEITRIRQQGYAYSENELADGAWGIAVPILDRAGAGDCVASLAVAGPLARFERSRVRQYMRLLRAAAGALAQDSR
ncbi:MAG: IclR family transcriptional regulator [candidate division NC10 bacterium]